MSSSDETWKFGLPEPVNIKVDLYVSIEGTSSLPPGVLPRRIMMNLGAFDDYDKYPELFEHHMRAALDGLCRKFIEEVREIM